MTDYKNPDTIGNRFEVFGSEGWPDLQERDPWEGVPDFDEHEEKNRD